MISCDFIKGALRWEQEPDNPTIVVEGINSTNVTLSWTYSLDPGATLQGVVFERTSRENFLKRTSLLSRLPNQEFRYLKDEFVKEYRANLPSRLVLLDVNNDEEYMYSVVVQYNDMSMVLYHVSAPMTAIIVQGKYQKQLNIFFS